MKRMGDPVDVIGHLPFPDAHNIVLNNLAESGIVGLVGLLATIVLLGLAIRASWRRSPAERLVIGGALVGLAIFAGHGMVDVIFGLVGTIVVAVAVTAIATTNGSPAEPSQDPGPRTLRAGLVVAACIAVLVTVATFNTERTVRTVGAAETALARDPAHALELARRATAAAPDMVSAWWIQMVAADAVGDTATAVEAARKVTELEGFGQQWISLAILAGRQGDRTTEDSALAASSGRLPIDPMVELNAIALLAARGETAAAADAARRLLAVQPDIEPILRGAPAPVAAAVAEVRADVARRLLAGGDPGKAFLVALSGGGPRPQRRAAGSRRGGRGARWRPALADDRGRMVRRHRRPSVARPLGQGRAEPRPGPLVVAPRGPVMRQDGDDVLGARRRPSPTASGRRRPTCWTSHRPPRFASFRQATRPTSGDRGIPCTRTSPAPGPSRPAGRSVSSPAPDATGRGAQRPTTATTESMTRATSRVAHPGPDRQADRPGVGGLGRRELARAIAHPAVERVQVERDEVDARADARRSQRLDRAGASRCHEPERRREAGDAGQIQVDRSAGPSGIDRGGRRRGAMRARRRSR